MLTVGPCESLCFTTWKSYLPGICHHFSFQKGQGKARDVCSPGRNWLEVQLCDGWAGWQGGLHRSQPEQRAGCSHWGCWGRCQARTGGFLCSLEKQKSFVGVSLSLKQHKNTRSQTGLDFSSSDKAFGFLLSPDSWALLCLRCAQFSPFPLEAAWHYPAVSKHLWWVLFRKNFATFFVVNFFPFVLWDLVPEVCFLRESPHMAF